jgi:hypothetical protein
MDCIQHYDVICLLQTNFGGRIERSQFGSSVFFLLLPRKFDRWNMQKLEVVSVGQFVAAVIDDVFFHDSVACVLL